MKGRRLIAFIAIVGLLAQAAALVRHHLVMLSGSLGTAASTALSPLEAVPCHAVKLAAKPIEKNADLGTAKKASGCPICSGLCAAVLAMAPPEAQLVLPAHAPVSLKPTLDRRVVSLVRGRPSARGPPDLG